MSKEVLVELEVNVSEDEMREFEKICANSGIDVSTAINLFLEASLREKGLPFPVEPKAY